MSTQTKWIIFITLIGPLVWLFVKAEVLLFNTIPEEFHWMAIWVQVILFATFLIYQVKNKVIVPFIHYTAKKRNQQKLERQIQEYQKNYDDSRERPSLYVVTAGSVARVVWTGLENFSTRILAQALKIFLLLPTEDFVNASDETSRSLDTFGQLNPAPIKLKQVSSGKMQKSGADAARSAEKDEIQKDFKDWSEKALEKTSLVFQLIGISNGKNDRPGYTSTSVFRAFPFIGLRNQVGNKVSGEIPRWTVLVLDIAEQDWNSPCEDEESLVVNTDEDDFLRCNTEEPEYIESISH